MSEPSPAEMPLEREILASGFEVTLVDREPGPALETSFANAGQVSPGYAAPWAAPGVPLAIPDCSPT